MGAAGSERICAAQVDDVAKDRFASTLKQQ